jgi:hypothetical protein
VKAEIFSIGTELLMGELTDTNAAWMAARLPALGIQLQGISLVTRLLPYVWGYDDDTPEQALGKILTVRGWTLATMDCCTGGYLANSITDLIELGAENHLCKISDGQGL